MALSDAAREAISRPRLYGEFLLKLPPSVILSDNQGALNVTEDPANYQKAKHIDIRYVRHALHSDYIYIPSPENSAGILTKALESFGH